MSETFSLVEVFRIAEGIERNGQRFYSRAAEVVEHPEARQLLRELARWEEKHLQRFQDMRQECCERMDLQWVDPDGQAEAYLKAVADNHVFDPSKDPEALREPLGSTESIVQVALEYERDTVAYLTALKAVAPGVQGERVDLLIEEELRHIAVLGRLKQRL